MTKPPRSSLSLMIVLCGCAPHLVPLHERAAPAGDSRSICTVDGLCWENPLPQGESLRGLTGIGPDQLMVAGGNTLFRTDGRRWTATSVPGWDGVIALWAASATSVFAVGERGLILHYDGTRWSRMEPGAKDLSILWSVVGRSDREVYASATVETTKDGHTRYSGMILRYDGTRWLREHEAADTVYALWLGPRGEIIGVGDAGLIVARKGGAWTRIPSGARDRLYTVWGSDGTNVYAGGDGGVLRYDGRAWSPVAGPRNQIQRIWGTGPNQVFAAETSGIVYRFDGARWNEEKSGAEWLRDLWGRSPREVFAVGGSGMLARFDGQRWSRLTEGRTEILRAVGPGPGGRLYVAGDDGAVLVRHGRWWSVEGLGRSKRRHVIGTSWVALWGGGDAAFVLGDDRVARHDGRSWTTIALPEGARPRSLWGTGPRELFVVGGEGAILRFDGKTWARMSSGVDADLVSVSGWGREIWAAGKKGTLVVYDGARWDPVGISTREDLLAVQAVAPGEIWVVAFGGELHHYRRGEWEKFKPPCTIAAAAATGRQDVFFVGGEGCVLHWDGDRFRRTRAKLSGVGLSAAHAAARELVVVGSGGALLRMERTGPRPPGWALLEEKKWPE